MTLSYDCPDFLKPRLRLFLSADIIGSTALKQSKLGALGNSATPADVSWFTTIQGFYFEAQYLFLSAWKDAGGDSGTSEFFGEAPRLWKTIGDEVLFTKLITDHRQISVTLNCWVKTLSGIREFLTRDSSRLGVKSTAWIAGFPFRNKEVVLSTNVDAKHEPIGDYYKESGLILNRMYSGDQSSDIIIDYVGPSIDTGFRLTGLSDSRKLIVSLDVAYIISLTSPVKTAPVEPIKLRYDGQVFLKGVLGGTNYPVFWIDLSGDESSAQAEDLLTGAGVCDRDNVREFCDAFYGEHRDYIFPPFIDSLTEPNLTDRPSWYEENHMALIKNFNESIIPLAEPAEPVSPPSGESFAEKLSRMQAQWNLLMNRHRELDTDI